MAHPYDEYAGISFGQWASIGVKLGGRSVVDQVLRDELKFVRRGSEITIEPRLQPASRPGVAIVPANDVEFELTLKAPIDGLKLLELFGCPNGSRHGRAEWSYEGQQMVDPLTRRFKLVSVGECRHLSEVLRRLTAYSGVPQGQWLEAFRRAYPKYDGHGFVGVADPSWFCASDLCTNGHERFPILAPAANSWDPHFTSMVLTGDDKRRWLVECE